MLPYSRPLGGNRADMTGGDWGFVLLCVLVLVAAALLVAFPVAISSRRGNPLRELILAGSLFWGALAAWSAFSWIIASWNWSREKNTLMLAGYYQTVAADPGPQVPWTRWGLLGAFFLVLLGLAFRGSSASRP